MINDCCFDDYKTLQKNFQNLLKDEQVNSYVYGKSFLGRDLVAFHKGNNFGKQFLITGGIHAREYISSFVVMNLLKDYNLPYGCIFIPLLNPDGVMLCLGGLSTVKEEYKNFVLRLNNYSTDFSLWKANARGVDLNVNFDMMWGKGKLNKKVPGSENYIGEYANSEIENICLLKYLTKFDIQVSLSYHAKGEVVYYRNDGNSSKIKKKTKKLASILSKMLNYKTIETKNSYGGLSDYLYSKNIASLTIELGRNELSHPIRESNLKEIYLHQYDALENLFNYASKYG